jgi:2,4-dienoyl-CoA reductase (NADPH2)
VVAAIQAEAGRDFHLQVKLSATEYNDAMVPFEPRGNTIVDSVRVARWLDEAGVDAIHVSTGSSFPHPRNPAGDLPVQDALATFDTLISSGTNELRNYLALSTPAGAKLFQFMWDRARGDRIEGINLDDSRAIRSAVNIPVICTGGFQTASVIRQAIEGGSCDAVSIARSLVANNSLVEMFAQGLDRAPKPCTYCNKCLVNVLENPLGCYDETRYASREEMIREIMSVYEPAPFSELAAGGTA